MQNWLEQLELVNEMLDKINVQLLNDDESKSLQQRYNIEVLLNECEQKLNDLEQQQQEVLKLVDEMIRLQKQKNKETKLLNKFVLIEKFCQSFNTLKQKLELSEDIKVK